MKFTKAPSKINRGIAIAVYADPGTGKTTLASTLEEGKTLIINTEAGLGPLIGTKHILFNVDKSGPISQFEDMIRYLRTQQHPFKNVVLDNLSDLEQWYILKLTQDRKKEYTELKEYGDASNKLRQTLHDFRDLVDLGINVIINAWEAPIEIKSVAGEVVTKVFPKISKKIAPELCGIVDMVARLEVYEKTGQRWLRFGPSEQYITKCQFKGIDNGEPANLPAILEKVLSYEYGKEEGKKGGLASNSKQAQGA
jgi:phage nucleotide-binding protein